MRLNCKLWPHKHKRACSDAPKRCPRTPQRSFQAFGRAPSSVGTGTDPTNKDVTLWGSSPKPFNWAHIFCSAAHFWRRDGLCAAGIAAWSQPEKAPTCRCHVPAASSVQEAFFRSEAPTSSKEKTLKSPKMDGEQRVTEKTQHVNPQIRENKALMKKIRVFCFTTSIRN